MGRESPPTDRTRSSSLIIDGVPFVLRSDLCARLRGHRRHCLSLRRGSVAKIVLESGLWENEHDGQRPRPRVLEGDSDGSGDVNGAALANNGLLFPERHFGRSLVDEDDLISVKMPM